MVLPLKCISQFQLRPSPSGYCGAFACLVSTDDDDDDDEGEDCDDDCNGNNNASSV